MSERDLEIYDFILEDNEEREVLYTVGKYNVFAPNEETNKIIEELINMSDKKTEVSELDFMMRAFANLTNVPDSVLNKSRFEKIMKSNRKKQAFKKLNFYIQYIIDDGVLEYLMRLDVLKKMPHEAKEKYVENMLEAYKNYPTEGE